LVPVDWRHGHQIKGPFPCVALQSTELSQAKGEAFMTKFPYGAHLIRGIATCKDVIDIENRMYIFECPGYDINPRGPLAMPQKPQKEKPNPWA